MSLTCIHIFLHCTVTIIAMVILDVYLVQQNHGDRKTGVLVMLAIQEFCHIIALRYFSKWVASQLKTLKRGYSIISWFVFIVIYDIKMYFIMEHIWKTCVTSTFPESSAKETNSLNLVTKTLHVSSNNNSPQDDDLDHRASDDNCGLDASSKKILALTQVVLLAGLYLLLVGADYVQGPRTLLVAVKIKAFWATSDVFDLLQLQTSIWEEVTGQFPYALAAFVYFYCYVGLIIIPPLAMAEMSRDQNDTAEEISLSLHHFIRITLVFIGSSVIRAYLIVAHTFTLTSTVFLGKNVICLAIEINALIGFCTNSRNGMNAGNITENTSEEMPNNELANGDAMIVDDGSLYQEVSQINSENNHRPDNHPLFLRNDFHSNQKIPKDIISPEKLVQRIGRSSVSSCPDSDSSSSLRRHVACSADTNNTSSDLISFGSKSTEKNHPQRAFGKKEELKHLEDLRSISKDVPYEQQPPRPNSCEECSFAKPQGGSSDIKYYRLPTLSSPPSLGSAFSRTSVLPHKPLEAPLVLSPPSDFASSVEIDMLGADNLKETSFFDQTDDEEACQLNDSLNTSNKFADSLSSVEIVSFPNGELISSASRTQKNNETLCPTKTHQTPRSGYKSD